MYPRTIIGFNIARNTMIGKLEIEGFPVDRYPHIFQIKKTKNKKTEEDEEDELDLIYNAGKDFMDNYLTNDIISIGTKWFNLPDFEAVDKEFRKKFKIKKKKILNLNKFIGLFADGVDVNIRD